MKVHDYVSDTVIHHETADIELPCFIGEHTRIWNRARIRKRAKIGQRCIIGEGVHIDEGVIVGDRCKIQNGAQLFKGVTLQDDIFIGPHVIFTNVRAPRAFIERKDEFEPTVVEKGASIGANATIRCGVTIGSYAVVGAAAVVTKDVAPHAIVTGNPMLHVAWACRCGYVVTVHEARAAGFRPMTCQACTHSP